MESERCLSSRVASIAPVKPTHIVRSEVYGIAPGMLVPSGRSTISEMGRIAITTRMTTLKVSSAK